MMVRRSGVFIAGVLVLAACSSGSDAEPTPLETPPPATTAAPSTEDTPDPTVPSTEANDEVEETAPETDPTTTEAPEPPDVDGPVEVFREAATAFNEVQLNPQDESIRPAAYDLMTERFRADRGFEILTGDPEFLDPWKSLVVFGSADVDESGGLAVIWYCQRQIETDPESGFEISVVRRAEMELVDGQWLWASRELFAVADEEDGCPEDTETTEAVAGDLLESVEAAAVAYLDAIRLAVEDPRNEALLEDLSRRSGGAVSERDDRLLAQTIELDLQVLRDPAVSTEARLLGAHQLAGGDVKVFVCVPDNTKAVRPGDDPDDQEFVRRSLYWGITFSQMDDAWVAIERELIVASQFSGKCEPLL